MTQLIRFPGLGLEFQINPVAFSLGSFHIFWYGIIVTTGIFLSILYILRRSKQFGLDPDKLLDLAMFAVFAGIIGARIYYVAFSWDYYKDNLIDIFKIYEGGIAIYGGLIGGAIAVYYLCKRYQMRFLPVLDIAGTALLLGQGIGRWGNFVNVEAFGSNTTLPWGMTAPRITEYLMAVKDSLSKSGVIVDPAMPVHPTFLYESVWCLIGFGVLAWYTSRRKFDGELVLLYAIWNGSGRFVIEGLRTDSLMMGNIRISQLLAGLAVLASVALLVYLHKNPQKRPALSTPLTEEKQGDASLDAEPSQPMEESTLEHHADPASEETSDLAQGASAHSDINLQNTEEDTNGTIN